METNFSDLPLHDSIVESISVDWKSSSCIIKVDTPNGMKVVRFADVSKVAVPM